MIIVRVFTDIKKHFPVRRSEWIGSGVMILWGLFMILDERSTVPGWVGLGRMLQGNFGASLLMVLGSLRLLALIINGTFQKTWYGKISPHVRVFASIVSCMVWLQLWLALWNGPYWTTGLAAYAGYFVHDVLNAFAAAGDAKELDKARQDANATARTDKPV